jgi:hypothetical protein
MFHASPDEYVQVFNVLNSGFTSYQPILFSLFALLILIGIYYFDKADLEKYPVLKIFRRKDFTGGLFFLLAFPIVGTCFLFSILITYSQYASLSDGMKLGKYQLLEGVVENFKPAAESSKPPEKFTVAGHDFELREYDVTSAFHQTSFYGSPIRNGIKVRIYCVGGEIAKLEIRKSDLAH